LIYNVLRKHTTKYHETNADQETKAHTWTALRKNKSKQILCVLFRLFEQNAGHKILKYTSLNTGDIHG